MYKQGSTRISMVIVAALALLGLLIASATGQTHVALAKADSGLDLAQAQMRPMQPMTDTMPMGQMGMGRNMQMMGMMMQMMGQMQDMMPAGNGMMGAMPMTKTLPMASAMPMTRAMPMTTTMRMTSTMPMGRAGMAQTMGQMRNLMLQQMQSMLVTCPGAMTHAMTGTMTMTGAMPMGSMGMNEMSQMMQMMGQMQTMMGRGMGMMNNTMPMTTTMPMRQPGPGGQMGMMGRNMQMMGMMMQMMGQMQTMMGMETDVMSNTMPMTGAMPMRTELCQMMGALDQMMQMTGSGMQPFDLLFIDSMIMHHQSAVDMAKEAQQQAQHPELKQMADDIISSQTAEIKQMEAWRKAWYPNAPATSGLGMSMGTMQIAADASKPFDLRFIEAMIPHHQGAIAMAKAAQVRSQHQEIKTLAGNIIAAQQKEIAQMQAWKAAWFK